MAKKPTKPKRGPQHNTAAAISAANAHVTIGPDRSKIAAPVPYFQRDETGALQASLVIGDICEACGFTVRLTHWQLSPDGMDFICRGAVQVEDPITETKPDDIGWIDFMASAITAYYPVLPSPTIFPEFDPAIHVMQPPTILQRLARMMGFGR